MTDRDFLAFLFAVAKNASTPNPYASTLLPSPPRPDWPCSWLPPSCPPTLAPDIPSYVVARLDWIFLWMLPWLDGGCFAGLSFSFMGFWFDFWFWWFMKDDNAKGWSDRRFFMVVAYLFFLVCGCCNKTLRAFWRILMELVLRSPTLLIGFETMIN